MGGSDGEEGGVGKDEGEGDNRMRGGTEKEGEQGRLIDGESQEGRERGGKDEERREGGA